MIRTFKEEGRLTSTDVIRTQSTGKNTIPRCDAGRNGKSQGFNSMIYPISILAVSPAGILVGFKDIGGVLFHQACRLVSPNGCLVHRVGRECERTRPYVGSRVLPGGVAGHRDVMTAV